MTGSFSASVSRMSWGYDITLNADGQYSLERIDYSNGHCEYKVEIQESGYAFVFTIMGEYGVVGTTVYDVATGVRV